MPFAVDHVFVFCRPGAPEAARLEAAGLRAGAQRRHEGQGTANTCFHFGDAMLELLWVADEQEARLPHVQPLGLVERWRWRETGACPLGVCVHTDVGAAPPFPAWDYAPAFMPKERPIRMACNSGIVGEPLLFALQIGVDRPAAPLAEHPLRALRLSRCDVQVRGLAPMSLLRDVRVPRLSFTAGAAHLLTLELGDGARGRALDLRPELPLVLRW